MSGLFMVIGGVLCIVILVSMAIGCVDAAWSAIRELKDKLRGGNV